METYCRIWQGLLQRKCCKLKHLVSYKATNPFAFSSPLKIPYCDLLTVMVTTQPCKSCFFPQLPKQQSLCLVLRIFTLLQLRGHGEFYDLLAAGRSFMSEVWGHHMGCQEPDSECNDTPPRRHVKKKKHTKKNMQTKHRTCGDTLGLQKRTFSQTSQRSA